MVTMATDMAHKIKKPCLILTFLSFLSPASAGDWTFTPAISLNETYSTNIESARTDKTDSLVTQASAILQSKYESQKADLVFVSSHSIYAYSHDSELNDDTRSLSATGSIDLIDSLSLSGSASINNINRNDTNNGLDDLVVANTVESRTYNVGLDYSVDNNDFSLDSSIAYSLQEVDDGIGESEGYNIDFATENGSNARNVFWVVDGSYNDRKNSGNTGRSYDYEAKIGWISPYKFTPFIRYYDEDSSGSISNSSNTETKSWGPGIQWQVSNHVTIDASYNYVNDSSESDDYIDAQIDWAPSSRTTLLASYSERFFGKSYDVDFTHRNKRLSNTVKYSEDLTAFSRDSYELNDQGELELVEDSAFSLTKTLSWNSTLSLARTTFALTLSNRKRESLEDSSDTDSFSSLLSASRNLSRISTLALNFNFTNRDFNSGSSTANTQTDYYRTYSTSYTRQLLNSLSLVYSAQYTNRSSSNADSNYDEVRASININKEF